MIVAAAQQQAAATALHNVDFILMASLIRPFYQPILITLMIFRLKYCALPLPDNTVIAFLRNVRGVLFFAALTLNTTIWIIPILFLAVIRLLLPIASVRRLVARILSAIGENWISINSFLMRNLANVTFSAEGLEGLRRDGWYLVMANHQTWVDIVVLQAVFNRKIPFLKFFIKQQLIWFPLLGFAWWAMDMPFMKRFSPAYLARNPHMKGKDLETTRRACEKFRDTPTSVINFIEGTRFTEAKKTARKSPYRNLLQPRAGGLAVALSSMGELFTSVVDVTLSYTGSPTSLWGMCCGAPTNVNVIVQERQLENWMIEGDYAQDRDFRKKVHRWLGDIWSEKDAILDGMKSSESVQDGH